jgi:hypothetical protein
MNTAMNHPDRDAVERNARIAYEVVVTRRIVDLFDRREAYVSFHFRAVDSLARTHGGLVPVEFHRKTILLKAFGFDRPEAAS